MKSQAKRSAPPETANAISPISRCRLTLTEATIRASGQAVLNQFSGRRHGEIFYTELGLYPVNKNGGYLYPHSGQASQRGGGAVHGRHGILG